jgi:hypothetical protein
VLPLGVQLVAVAEAQVIVVVLKAATELAAKVRVGAAGTATAAVAFKVTEVAGDEPLALLQVSVKVSLPTAVGVIFWLPFEASVPLQLPEAAQLVAPGDDQAMVVELPTATVVEASVSVGAARLDDEVAASATELCAVVPEAFVHCRL